MEGTGCIVHSDEFGSFFFENTPPNEYILLVSAPGYRDLKIEGIKIAPDISRRIFVRLEPKIYDVGKITVRGERVLKTGGGVTVIPKREIEQKGIKSLPELLETVDGVFIQKTGPNGRTQVKIRGSNPGHVLVLLDGQKINPSGSGVADLSGIPIDMVEQVEVHKGGASSKFGPDALAGAINIITRPTRLFRNLSIDGERGWGSWKTEIYSLNLTNPVASDKYSGKFAYKAHQCVGDFDFAYSVAGSNDTDTTHTGTRVNNCLDSYNYFGSGIVKFNDKFNINYSGQYYRSISGLPDRATRQNETASMCDHRKLLTTGLNYETSADHRYNLELGFSEFGQRFLDPDTLNSLRFDSKFTNEIYTARFTQNHSFWKSNIQNYGVEFRRDVLYHSDFLRPDMDMGRTTRKNFSVYYSGEQGVDISKLYLFYQAILDVSFRYDYARTVKDSTSWQDTVKTNSVEHWSPKIGLALSGGKDLSYNVRAGYGKSFRLPTINALFWKGDIRSRGNPGLKPEKSEHSDIAGELNFRLGIFNLSAGLTYFHSYIKDLVVWSPDYQGVWRPVNLASACITGHEDNISLGFFEDRFEIIYQNTVTTALNKVPGHNSYNKKLTFYPGYITNITSRLNLGWLSASYSIRFVDKAYTNQANTRFYDSYRLDDFRIGTDINISKYWRLSADVKIDNIRNVDYVLMTHYPMPKRQWSFFIKIAYGIKEKKD